MLSHLCGYTWLFKEVEINSFESFTKALFLYIYGYGALNR